LEFYFRHSLGLVQYHLREATVSHEDYMWSVIGERGRSRYPGFSSDPLDGFWHLLRDLEEHGHTFLAGSHAEFFAHVQRAGSFGTGPRRIP